MPSGRTHDSITLWGLPLVAGATFGQTQSASLTLFLSGGYLFSGLMFGPDLDTYSHQYKRWGVLRWIWLPYRRSMRHRAFLSHGPVVGTLVRLVYLFSWLAVLLGGVALVSAIAYWATGELAIWQQTVQYVWVMGHESTGRSLQHHIPEWIALVLGLELGALSHSASDWLGSWIKRRINRSRSRKVSRPRPACSQPPTASPPPPTVELPPVPPPSLQADSRFPPFKE